MVKRYLKVMSEILPWYASEIFVNKFKKIDPPVLPQKVMEFSLVKNLKASKTPFAVGLYKSKAGKKVVVKIWENARKDIYYFNLIHQIKVTKALSAVQNRISLEKRSGFSIPTYVASSQNDKRIVLVMEQVLGIPLEDVKNEKEKFEIYKKCLIFLSTLSANMTKSEKEMVITKNVWDFVVLYPFILMTAIFVQKHLVKTLLKGIAPFIKGIIPLSKMKPDTLVHGDIHPDNIIVTGNGKFSLIDLENVKLSYALYEPVTTVSLKGNSQEFKNLLVKAFLKPRYKNLNDKRAIEALMVNNLTHNLSGDSKKSGVISYKKAFAIVFN